MRGQESWKCSKSEELFSPNRTNQLLPGKKETALQEPEVADTVIKAGSIRQLLSRYSIRRVKQGEETECVPAETELFGRFYPSIPRFSRPSRPSISQTDVKGNCLIYHLQTNFVFIKAAPCLNQLILGSIAPPPPRTHPHSIFYVCAPPPPQYVMHHPVTEHVSLHGKSLCKNNGTCVWGVQIICTQ